MFDGNLALAIFAVVQFALAGTFVIVTGYMDITGTRLHGVKRFSLLACLFLPYVAALVCRNFSFIVENAHIALPILIASSIAGFIIAARLIKSPLERKGPSHTRFCPAALDRAMTDFNVALCGSRKYNKVEINRMGAEWFLASQTLDLWHAITTIVGVRGKHDNIVRRPDITLLWKAWSGSLNVNGMFMNNIWKPAAIKRWNLMFASYGKLEDVAEEVVKAEHDHMRAELLGEKCDFAPPIADAFEAAWKTLGMMTAEHGPRCADEEELGGYWQDAARLTGVASTLEALRVGVPAEDVLVGLEEVPERWAISAVNEGSFAI